MAQLSTIISSILRDIVVAQHEANMYAMSLEDVYRQNGRLEQFALPTVAVGEVELDLRYGVNSDSVQTEQYEISYPLLRKFAMNISRQFAQAIVDRVLPLLQAAFPDDGTNGEAKVLADFAMDKNLQRKYCAFLGRKILKAMQEYFTLLINEDGTVNKQYLQEAVNDACEMYLLRHEDLKALFERTGGNKVQENIEVAIQEVVNEQMAMVLKNVNLKRKRISPSMDVVLEASELANLPEDCVQTLHFHISPNSLKLYSDE